MPLFNAWGFENSQYYCNELYHTAGTTYHNRVIITFGTKLPKLGNSNILDAGCSKGITTKEISLLYRKSRVFGVDIHAERINEAIREKSSARTSFIVGDFYMPEELLKNTSLDGFDAVFLMNNFYFTLKNTDSRDALDKGKVIGSLVKENGFLLISGRSLDSEDNFVILEKNKSSFKVFAENMTKKPVGCVHPGLYEKIMLSFGV